MDVHVLNVVACNSVTETDPTDLLGVGSRWKEPPPAFAIWVEVSNPSERAFTLNLEIYRGRDFLGDSGEELVLAGQSYWSGAFLWQQAVGIQPKSYNVTVVVDDAPARTVPLDFGHPEGK